MRLANLSSQYKPDTNVVTQIVSIVLKNKQIAGEPGNTFTLSVSESHYTYSDIYLVIKDNTSKMQVNYLLLQLK